MKYVHIFIEQFLKFMAQLRRQLKNFKKTADKISVGKVY